MIAKDLVPIPGSGAYLGTVTLPGLREPAHAPHKHHWSLLCCPPGGRWPPGYRLGYPGGHRPRYQPVRLPRSTRNMRQSPPAVPNPSRSWKRPIGFGTDGTSGSGMITEVASPVKSAATHGPPEGADPKTRSAT